MVRATLHLWNDCVQSLLSGYIPKLAHDIELNWIQWKLRKVKIHIERGSFAN